MLGTRGLSLRILTSSLLMQSGDEKRKKIMKELNKHGGNGSESSLNI
jgi:hypothetical protein